MLVQNMGFHNSMLCAELQLPNPSHQPDRCQWKSFRQVEISKLISLGSTD